MDILTLVVHSKHTFNKYVKTENANLKSYWMQWIIMKTGNSLWNWHMMLIMIFAKKKKNMSQVLICSTLNQKTFCSDVHPRTTKGKWLTLN